MAHCLEGKSLLLSGMPGTGKTHLAKRIVTQLSELGEGVVLISKTHCSVQNLGLGAQTADRWVRLLPGGLWADIAELSTNRQVRSRRTWCTSPNEALPPLDDEVELGHPSLQSLGVLRILVAHRDPGLVPLPAAGSSSRSARAPRFPATPSSPERAGRRTPSSRPDTWAGPAAPRRKRPRPLRFGSVVPIHAAGHGAVLALGGLVAVQHLPAAVHDEQGRLAPLAELADLLAGDALPLPVPGADGIEVAVDLLEGEPQQLRELAHHAEPVVPLLEGALQNLGAPEELEPFLLGHVKRSRDWGAESDCEGHHGGCSDCGPAATVRAPEGCSDRPRRLRIVVSHRRRVASWSHRRRIVVVASSRRRRRLVVASSSLRLVVVAVPSQMSPHGYPQKPAPIPTGILTPRPSPPVWSSRSRVIRPRLCHHRYPH